MKTDKKDAGLTLVDPPATTERRAPVGPAAREITLAGLWLTFRRGFWLIGLITLVAVLLAALALKLKEPLYEAGMTVAPASRDLAAAGRLVAELDQYAGLVGLAQTPGRFEPVSTLDRYLALLTSTKVAERLIDDPSLAAALVGAERDEQSGDWQPPDGLADRIRQAIFSFFGFPTWQEPGPAALAARLASLLEVKGTSGIHRLTVNLSEPELGVRLLGAMHEAADDILRSAALAETRRQIAELEAQLDEQPAPTRRDALEALLESRYQTAALLEIDQPYAAMVIDAPAASGWPSSIDPRLVLALAAFVGAIVGLFVVFLRDALRSSQT